MNTFLILLLTAGALGSYVPSNSRIVGGSQAQEGQFPYQVSIKLAGNHNCGGCIITPTTVLTAAHCFLRLTIYLFQINAGINDVYQIGQEYNVSSYKMHTGFASTHAQNDIAVAHIAGNFVYNNLVQPIPLGTHYVEGGVDAVLSGWGFLSYPGSTSQMMQFINTRTYPNLACKIKNALMKYEVLETNICTLTIAGEGACKGDSGGPLVVNGNVVGIVSWSNPCAHGTPDVFTRVSSYIAWIILNL